MVARESPRRSSGLEASTWRSRWREAAGPLLLGHGVAYPAAFACAFAWIPVIILADETRLAVLDEREAALFVLQHLAWPGLVAFALAHLAAVPWAFGRDRKKGRLIFFALVGGLFALALVVGGVFWTRLYRV